MSTQNENEEKEEPLVDEIEEIDLGDTFGSAYLVKAWRLREGEEYVYIEVYRITTPTTGEFYLTAFDDGYGSVPQSFGETLCEAIKNTAEEWRRRGIKDENNEFLYLLKRIQEKCRELEEEAEQEEEEQGGE